MIKLDELSVRDLLRLHGNIGAELKRRNIVRSANAPTGDLAEYIFCKAFNWTQEDNSKAGYDAIDGNVRYQIKSRRLDQGRGSRQLSFIRNIETKPFDHIGAVIFNLDYSIWRAAIIPYDLVNETAYATSHVNGHRFMLRDNVWDAPDVRDVTEDLRRVVL